ncbi:MAG TPA: hypothetical protein PKA63_09505 [Oligoflexia bacterium]|nr:hypothetical protein [Oligoflexia bacterium]HMP48890.1 hypothetical protein [Oligoflexia bacterium]
MKKFIFASIILLLFLFACTNHTEDPNLTWLKVPSDKQFGLIEKHFRGFDTTMIEVGYRYNELYWAGSDKNWEFANSIIFWNHVAKIKEKHS